MASTCILMYTYTQTTQISPNKHAHIYVPYMKTYTKLRCKLWATLSPAVPRPGKDKAALRQGTHRLFSSSSPPLNTGSLPDTAQFSSDSEWPSLCTVQESTSVFVYLLVSGPCNRYNHFNFQSLSVVWTLRLMPPDFSEPRKVSPGRITLHLLEIYVGGVNCGRCITQWCLGQWCSSTNFII